MDLHFKADPVILTFSNPVSAYHGLVLFNQWVVNQGTTYNIYAVAGPQPPVARQYSGLGGLIWSNIYPPTGQIGYVPSWDDSIIYENKTTVTCKYKVRGVIKSASNASSYYSTARQIIKENKKRQGFTKFEAWTSTVQVEDNIPLAWGSEDSQSVRMYWTPALEAEWL